MNVAIKETVFNFRKRTIETSGIPIVKIRDTLYPLVQPEQPELDHKIVRQPELGFRFISQCSVRSGPFYQSPLDVVFKFLLACSLGICALGKSEDVARVDALLSALSSFSAVSSFSAFASLSLPLLDSGFLLLLWSSLGRNGTPA